ncbi:retron Ec67 family RNA-directed DNA polymerase/endonuclease [Pseudomonas sp. MWU12-2037]|uniref:retron Ec67 family RNA-directed DNA polymerase/endonuclease n=1 Tax=Pseudomonas sp. MWU12-2037 TaxID=2928690 RepID=UPI002010BB24|nr:retron Ec67 family RNA-directed DNA polymerase/endonuclease [Pseudomonas sp. MWU12-2037]
MLQDCSEEIEKAWVGGSDSKSTLSHGFVRKRSIITNAMMHLHKKNILNVDLKDFFDSFNFGRVRGFFITNREFCLNPDIATAIAQIACHDNKLPQGSPCSPVITNLITNILDIRLAALARSHSCTYSRYADDLTFSTREKVFPSQIMKEDVGSYTPGKKLKSEIKRAGFELNHKKTRIQYMDSRQDVTGLIVNKKPNTRYEYWRTVRSQCHSLFKSGSFTKKVDGKFIEGNIFELQGQLNFIDQIDYFNRLRQHPPLNPEYALSNHLINTRKLLTGREAVFSRFLYYRHFYGNETAAILCEGKTDNVYLKSALNKLALKYPRLAIPKSAANPYKLLVSFMNYTERTRFLLQLYGGTSYLHAFLNSFEEHYKFYNAPKPKNPVVIVLDNDSGFNSIDGLLKGKLSGTPYPDTLSKSEFRKADFIHVTKNLYVVLNPLGPKGEFSAIESLFSPATRNIKISGKSFNPENNMDKNTEFGKEIFASKVVVANKDTIDFSGFDVLLSRITMCLEHYDLIR